MVVVHGTGEKKHLGLTDKGEAYYQRLLNKVSERPDYGNWIDRRRFEILDTIKKLDLRFSELEARLEWPSTEKSEEPEYRKDYNWLVKRGMVR